jgi:hypothetical protein
MRTTILFALLALFTFACGGDKQTTAETEETTQEEAPAITISPMSASPNFPGAAITSMDYTDGKFSFGIEPGENNYTLKTQTADAEQKMCANSGQGQHIHLIIDDQPYAAKYEADFDYDVADGEHYLLAFLSRSYHESIKSEGAATVAKINVADKAVTSRETVSEPMLFYSRPKGTYVGKDTENIMLDFYLHNVTLGDEYKVKVEAGDQMFMVDSWQPYILKGLPLGENTITLTLVDAAGNTVDTPLNPVSRTFTLAADPAK